MFKWHIYRVLNCVTGMWYLRGNPPVVFSIFLFFCNLFPLLHVVKQIKKLTLHVKNVNLVKASVFLLKLGRRNTSHNTSLMLIGPLFRVDGFLITCMCDYLHRF